MPKFTVTVEVQQFIELEVEADHEDTLYCHCLHDKLPPETQEKLKNPLQHGKVTSTNIEVDEVVFFYPLHLGVDNYEFDYDFDTFNNNQILDIESDGEKLIILFSDGGHKLIQDEDYFYDFLKVFDFDQLKPEVQKLFEKVSFRLPF